MIRYWPFIALLVGIMGYLLLGMWRKERSSGILVTKADFITERGWPRYHFSLITQDPRFHSLLLLSAWPGLIGGFLYERNYGG